MDFFYNYLFVHFSLKNSDIINLIQFPGVRHAIGYAVFSLILFITIQKHKYTLTFFAAINFGIFMETAQLFIPSREFHFEDIIWNFIGVASTLIIIFFLKLIRNGLLYKN